MKKFLLLINIFIIFNTYSFANVKDYRNVNSLEYELFRNNQLIGYHNYKFERKNEILTVKSVVEFGISKLGVKLYQYNAKSEEKYKNEIFFKFSAKTVQNKKNKYVNIQLNKGKNELTIDGSSYKGPASKDFIVGTWWNHEITKAEAQISAVSGRVIKQKVTFLGKEQVKIGKKIYNALHFNFMSSDKNLPKEKKLNTDIWYDEKTNLWIKAAFNKMGRWEYRLKKYN
tara:strand:+ start:281 stop:964 length:684 start_codon:yes stop_codon:yes gene_type:complete